MTPPSDTTAERSDTTSRNVLADPETCAAAADRFDDADTAAPGQTAKAILNRARADAALIRNDAIEAAQRIMSEAHERAGEVHREAQLRGELSKAAAGLPTNQVTDGAIPPQTPPPPPRHAQASDAEEAEIRRAEAILESFSPTATPDTHEQRDARQAIAQPLIPTPPPSPGEPIPDSKSFATLWNAETDDVDIDAFLSVELEETKKMRRFRTL